MNGAGESLTAMLTDWSGAYGSCVISLSATGKRASELASPSRKIMTFGLACRVCWRLSGALLNSGNKGVVYPLAVWYYLGEPPTARAGRHR